MPRFQNSLISDISEEDAELWREYNTLEKQLILRNVLTVDKLKFPQFICIGAQKAGTTWLYRNLKKHPQISLRQKEYHFYDKFYDQPIEAYSAFFKTNKNRVAGDITPSYCLIPDERIQLMHKVNPNARIIFMMRNPIDRAWSGLLMRFFKAEESEHKVLNEKVMLNYLRKSQVAQRGFYTDSIDRFSKAFGHNQVRVFDFDRIALNPYDLLKDIFEFIGVDDTIPAEKFSLDKVIHERKKDLEMPATVREELVNLYKREIDNLILRYPDIAEKWKCE